MHILDKMPNGDRGWGSWPYAALQDYAAARCCILNALLPAGLMLAQQCVEKLLKSYLRAANPGQTKWVGPNPTKTAPWLVPGVLQHVAGAHDLIAHAQLVDRDYDFGLISEHTAILQHLSWAFEGKYPDGHSEIKTMSGLDVFVVDHLVVPLFLKLPVDDSLRWRIGIHSLLADTRTNPPELEWVSRANVEFSLALPQMERDVANGRASLGVST